MPSFQALLALLLYLTSAPTAYINSINRWLYSLPPTISAAPTTASPTAHDLYTGSSTTAGRRGITSPAASILASTAPYTGHDLLRTATADTTGHRDSATATPPALDSIKTGVCASILELGAVTTISGGNETTPAAPPQYPVSATESLRLCTARYGSCEVAVIPESPEGSKPRSWSDREKDLRICELFAWLGVSLALWLLVFGNRALKLRLRAIERNRVQWTLYMDGTLNVSVSDTAVAWAECSALEMVITKADTALNDSISDTIAAHGECDALESKLLKQKEEILSLNGRLATAHLTIAGLGTTTARVHELSATAKQHEFTISVQKALLDCRNSQLSTTTSERDNAKTEVSNLKQKATINAKATAAQESTIQLQSEETKALNAKVVKLEASEEASQGEVTKAGGELDELKKQLEGSKSTVFKRESQIEGMESALATQANEIEKLKAAIGSLDQAKQAAEKKLTATHTITSGLQYENTRLEEQLKSAKSLEMESTGHAENLRQSNEKLAAQITEQEDKISQLKFERDQAENWANANNISQLQSQISDLQREYSASQAALQTMRQHCSVDKVEGLTRTLRKAHSDLDRANKTIQQLQAMCRCRCSVKPSSNGGVRDGDHDDGSGSGRPGSSGNGTDPGYVSGGSSRPTSSPSLSNGTSSANGGQKDDTEDASDAGLGSSQGLTSHGTPEQQDRDEEIDHSLSQGLSTPDTQQNLGEEIDHTIPPGLSTPDTQHDEEIALVDDDDEGEEEGNDDEVEDEDVVDRVDDSLDSVVDDQGHEGAQGGTHPAASTAATTSAAATASGKAKKKPHRGGRNRRKPRSKDAADEQEGEELVGSQSLSPDSLTRDRATSTSGHHATGLADSPQTEEDVDRSTMGEDVPSSDSPSACPPDQAPTTSETLPSSGAQGGRNGDAGTSDQLTPDEGGQRCVASTPSEQLDPPLATPATTDRPRTGLFASRHAPTGPKGKETAPSGPILARGPPHNNSRPSRNAVHHRGNNDSPNTPMPYNNFTDRGTPSSANSSTPPYQGDRGGHYSNRPGYSPQPHGQNFRPFGAGTPQQRLGSAPGPYQGQGAPQAPQNFAPSGPSRFAPRMGWNSGPGYGGGHGRGYGGGYGGPSN